MMSIAMNSQKIEGQIQASLTTVNRSRDEVTCVAVTKMRTVDEVASLYEEGYRNFAENRPEGLLEKQADLTSSDIVWHYVGSLQTRKVKQIINQIDYFHALDRLSLAKEIEKRANESISCFVQVNVTGETSKHGVSPDDLMTFIDELEPFSKIKVVGLMTMAPIDASNEELHRCFEALKQLQEKVAARGLSYAPCAETSMGMSGDFQVAIEEGATFIRIGSAFFE